MTVADTVEDGADKVAAEVEELRHAIAATHLALQRIAHALEEQARNAAKTYKFCATCDSTLQERTAAKCLACGAKLGP